MRLEAGLRRLERAARARKHPRVCRIFMHDDLMHCDEHRNCDVEIATGEHHRDVIHLTFGEREIAK